jgi:hypothetical protein
LIRVRANLEGVSREAFELTIDGLLQHRGYGPHFSGGEVLKARGGRGHDGEDFDSLFLRELARLLDSLFSGFIQRVVADIEELVGEGDGGLPLDLERGDHERLAQKMAQHAAAFLEALGLKPLSGVQVVERLPWALDFIDSAFRLGLVQGSLTPETPWKVAEQVTRRAVMTPADKEALHYLREGAGAYLRPVVEHIPQDAMRRLLARDREVVLRRTLVGVRARISPERLAGYMADLTGHKEDRGDGKLIWTGGSWERDWRRVARTEMAFAHSYGHLFSQLKAYPLNQGGVTGQPLTIPKRLVFKVPQKVRRDEDGILLAPCEHCYRLWYADDQTPRLYPLHEVIDNGENAGPPPRTPDEWKATVGPTHPNDLCGPLQFFNKSTTSIYPRMATQLPQFSNQGFEALP